MWGVVLLLPVLAVVVLLLIAVVRRYRRRRPRACEKCGSPMIRFGEAEDDEHLLPAQRKEEELGSVDYDVWACESCDHIVEHRYAASSTRYRTCSSCGARTESERGRTVRAATVHTTGLEEITVSCAHCDNHHTHTRVVPKRTPPNRSDSDDDDFSGGAGFSGGGDFSDGGGHSSGGGSSGSW